jgi:ParB-like chromosome segregation protein Spo0J
MPKPLTPHPVAMLFPTMNDADFAALVEDVRRNGVKVPILVRRGQIIDGKHRYRACQELGRPCPVTQWDGQDPWLEAQSRNLMRRQLAKDQVYAIRKLAAEQFPEIAAPIEAAKLESKKRQLRKPQDPRHSKPDLLRPRDRNKESADLIGSKFGVSGSTVKRVDRLAREAPELLCKVAAGELSALKALREVALRKNGKSSGHEDETKPFSVEPAVYRLRQSIETQWGKVPLTHRRAFLYGLQQIFRALLAEHSAASAPRLATGTEPGRNRDQKLPKPASSPQ